jgi:PAS domain S-box-containing protein
MESPIPERPTPPELPHQMLAASTAEMLAELPQAIVHPEGSSEDRRLGEVLALYRSVFVNSTEAIAILDANGRYLEQNVAHEMLIGYPSAELKGMSPAVPLGEETFARIVEDITAVGASRREVLGRTKDGRERVLDLSSFAVRDRAGRPVCYVGITRDVTDQRRSAEELGRRFAELQAVYRIADKLGRARAPEEMYEEAIDALLGLLHADRASVLLFDDVGIMRFRASRGLSDRYRAAVEGHSPWKRDERDPQPISVANVATDPALGGVRDVVLGEGIRALAFVPLVDDTALLGKLMIYFDQPHEWTTAELQLAATIARHVAFAVARQRRETELRDANHAKKDFLATMSHELRTPLNAIAGYTDLLEAGVHGDLTAKQADALRRIQVNHRHLLRLIDDVLDFAKLEAGHLQFEIANVPVQETLDATCALIETQLAAKHVAFECVAGDQTVTCRGDRAKIQQVLGNLLSNAWKFTPSGGTVRLSWDATATAVDIHVSDTGLGIAADAIEAAFKPFVQLQSGFRRRAEGTGLGLAISRELARGMGGDVTARSELGKGSVFTLTLPRTPSRTS